MSMSYVFKFKDGTEKTLLQSSFDVNGDFLQVLKYNHEKNNTIVFEGEGENGEDLVFNFQDLKSLEIIL